MTQPTDFNAMTQYRCFAARVSGSLSWNCFAHPPSRKHTEMKVLKTRRKPHKIPCNMRGPTSVDIETLIYSWWFQPLWRKHQSNWESSPSRDENKRYLKPPPRKCIAYTCHFIENKKGENQVSQGGNDWIQHRVRVLLDWRKDTHHQWDAHVSWSLVSTQTSTCIFMDSTNGSLLVWGLRWWFGILGMPLSNNPFHKRSQISKPPNI